MSYSPRHCRKPQHLLCQRWQARMGLRLLTLFLYVTFGKLSYRTSLLALSLHVAFITIVSMVAVKQPLNLWILFWRRPCLAAIQGVQPPQSWEIVSSWALGSGFTGDLHIFFRQWMARQHQIVAFVRLAYALGLSHQFNTGDTVDANANYTSQDPNAHLIW